MFNVVASITVKFIQHYAHQGTISSDQDVDLAIQAELSWNPSG